MKETIEFIYELIKKQNLNIGHCLELRPLITVTNPVIKNNLKQAFEQIVNDGILEDRNGTYFLTEKGFSVIWEQN